MATAAPLPTVPDEDPLIASHINLIIGFMAAVLQLAREQGVPISAGVGTVPALAERKVVHYMLPDGAVYHHEVESDSFFLGGLAVYAQQYLTVTLDGTGQTALLSGGAQKQLPQLLSGFSGNAAVPNYQRIRLTAGQLIYMNLNTGPGLVALIFEPIPT